ncbi:hypothetical protein RIF29_29400 [Crotalaria pallida]|uniref:Rad60/SUMO-like domain-containing protein n=1 Tax=Crotalaria pallida TaxID=3830 RepID=A0AAN9EEH8_CROPI
MFLGAVKDPASDVQCLGARQVNMVCLLFKNGGKYITRSEGPDAKRGNLILYYRTGKNVKFSFLMTDYSVRMELGLGTIHFVGPDGDTLRETHTPQDLGMKDGDVIDAFIPQVCG